MLGTHPAYLSSIPSTMWWKERADSHKLSYDSTGTQQCTHSHTCTHIVCFNKVKMIDTQRMTPNDLYPYIYTHTDKPSYTHHAYTHRHAPTGTHHTHTHCTQETINMWFSYEKGRELEDKGKERKEELVIRLECTQNRQFQKT